MKIDNYTDSTKKDHNWKKCDTHFEALEEATNFHGKSGAAGKFQLALVRLSEIGCYSKVFDEKLKLHGVSSDCMFCKSGDNPAAAQKHREKIYE